MESGRFEWDAHNSEHIGMHDVDPDEAEAVLDNDPLVLRTKDGKYLAYGQSDEGRYLLVVFARKARDLIRVITARDLTEGEKRQYRRRRT
jgi:uncharacterized DUF497 family protein